MKFYLAPMEEVTGYVFRNVYHELYGGIDKYFGPFIAPNQHNSFKTREKKEIAPENNRGLYVVPQILTNKSNQFCDTCEMLLALGYNEVNINMGCPSSTVVTKGKGSGMLVDIKQLHSFMEDIFGWRDNLHPDFKISVKTRLGIEAETEFTKILPIFEEYPLEELIIHPRVQKDYYKNTPHLETYKTVLTQSRLPVCYNGDLFTKKRFDAFVEAFPETECVMIGRGLVANPALLREISQGERVTKAELRIYHDKLYQAYTDALGCKDALFKMKEVWFYLSFRFADCEKYVKAIRKAESGRAYESAAQALFTDCSLKGE